MGTKINVITLEETLDQLLKNASQLAHSIDPIEKEILQAEQEVMLDQLFLCDLPQELDLPLLKKKYSRISRYNYNRLKHPSQDSIEQESP